MADPPPSGAGSTGGSTGGGIQNKVVKNLEDFSKLMPGYGEMSMAEIFASPIFNGPDAYLIDPEFYKELQGILLDLEKGYGVPVSEIPGGVFSNLDNLKQALKGGGSGGGGGGGGRAPQPYGMNAPDPAAAGQMVLQQYLAGLESIQTKQDAEQFIANFEKDWAQLGLRSKEAEGSDRMQREISEANRRVNVAEEAGRRAQTVGQSYLPYMLPGVQNMNIPLVGNLPLPQVNLGTIFNQGGPGNLQQLPGINPNPSVDYGIGPMPNLPAVPNIPALPNMDQYIQAAAAGSGPMGWY